MQPLLCHSLHTKILLTPVYYDGFHLLFIVYLSIILIAFFILSPHLIGTVSWVCRAVSQIFTLTLEALQSGTTSCEEKRSACVSQKHCDYAEIHSETIFSFVNEPRFTHFIYVLILNLLPVTHDILSLPPTGVLADSTHTTKPGDVWELGFIRKTGRYFLGRQMSRLSENYAVPGQHLHNPIRFVNVK